MRFPALTGKLLGVDALGGCDPVDGCFGCATDDADAWKLLWWCYEDAQSETKVAARDVALSLSLDGRDVRRLP